MFTCGFISANFVIPMVCICTTMLAATTLPTTTVTTEPTTPSGCEYNGKHYAPGSTIEEGYDESSNWCYGTICGMDGQIQNWDDFNCVKTTLPPTTIPPTTTPRTTTPTTMPGCVYNGKHYPPGSTIEKGYDPGSNWCYGTICDTNGQLQYWDDFHCVKTTTRPTTIKETTTPPTTTLTSVPGCVHNGKHYPPGSTIGKGYDPASNLCYFALCDSTGNIVYGDDFNCVKTASTPATVKSTASRQINFGLNISIAISLFSFLIIKRYCFFIVL